jgi:hypothetical protein
VLCRRSKQCSWRLPLWECLLAACLWHYVMPEACCHFSRLSAAGHHSFTVTPAWQSPAELQSSLQCTHMLSYRQRRAGCSLTTNTQHCVLREAHVNDFFRELCAARFQLHWSWPAAVDGGGIVVLSVSLPAGVDPIVAGSVGCLVSGRGRFALLALYDSRLSWVAT